MELVDVPLEKEDAGLSSESVSIVNSPSGDAFIPLSNYNSLAAAVESSIATSSQLIGSTMETLGVATSQPVIDFFHSRFPASSSPTNSTHSGGDHHSSFPAPSIFKHGDVVWAQTETFLPFWPAFVFLEHDKLPPHLHGMVGTIIGHRRTPSGNVVSTSRRKKLCVYFYGKDDFDFVPESKLKDFSSHNELRYSQTHALGQGAIVTFLRACHLAEDDLLKEPGQRVAWLPTAAAPVLSPSKTAASDNFAVDVTASGSLDGEATLSSAVPTEPAPTNFPPLSFSNDSGNNDGFSISETDRIPLTITEEVEEEVESEKGETPVEVASEIDGDKHDQDNAVTTTQSVDDQIVGNEIEKLDINIEAENIPLVPSQINTDSADSASEPSDESPYSFIDSIPAVPEQRDSTELGKSIAELDDHVPNVAEVDVDGDIGVDGEQVLIMETDASEIVVDVARTEIETSFVLSPLDIMTSSVDTAVVEPPTSPPVPPSSSPKPSSSTSQPNSAKKKIAPIADASTLFGGGNNFADDAFGSLSPSDGQSYSPFSAPSPVPAQSAVMAGQQYSPHYGMVAPNPFDSNSNASTVDPFSTRSSTIGQQNILIKNNSLSPVRTTSTPTGANPFDNRNNNVVANPFGAQLNDPPVASSKQQIQPKAASDASALFGSTTAPSQSSKAVKVNKAIASDAASLFGGGGSDVFPELEDVSPRQFARPLAAAKGKAAVASAADLFGPSQPVTASRRSDVSSHFSSSSSLSLQTSSSGDRLFPSAAANDTGKQGVDSFFSSTSFEDSSKSRSSEIISPPVPMPPRTFVPATTEGHRPQPQVIPALKSSSKEEATFASALPITNRGTQIVSASDLFGSPLETASPFAQPPSLPIDSTNSAAGGFPSSFSRAEVAHFPSNEYDHKAPSVIYNGPRPTAQSLWSNSEGVSTHSPSASTFNTLSSVSSDDLPLSNPPVAASTLDTPSMPLKSQAPAQSPAPPPLTKKKSSGVLFHGKAQVITGASPFDFDSSGQPPSLFPPSAHDPFSSGVSSTPTSARPVSNSIVANSPFRTGLKNNNNNSNSDSSSKAATAELFAAPAPGSASKVKLKQASASEVFNLVIPPSAAAGTSAISPAPVTSDPFAPPLAPGVKKPTSQIKTDRDRERDKDKDGVEATTPTAASSNSTKSRNRAQSNTAAACPPGMMPTPHGFVPVPVPTPASASQGVAVPPSTTPAAPSSSGGFKSATEAPVVTLDTSSKAIAATPQAGTPVANLPHLPPKPPGVTRSSSNSDRNLAFPPRSTNPGSVASPFPPGEASGPFSSSGASFPQHSTGSSGDSSYRINPTSGMQERKLNHGRPSYAPLVAFGFGGKLLTMFPRRRPPLNPLAGGVGLDVTLGEPRYCSVTVHL